MKKWTLILILGAFAVSCGGGQSDEHKTDENAVSSSTSQSASVKPKENPAYDPKRGVGKFNNVQISPTLNEALAVSGEKVYGVKCSGCHKTTEEKLVGPGWKHITKKYTADWILNFSTNTAEMLDKDPAAQAQLEICLVRMPNQNLSDDDALGIYEFMRKNDGVK